MTRRIYKSDPIHEAVCDVRFRGPDSGWAVFPGLLFNLLSDIFPSEPHQREGQTIQLGPDMPGAPQLRLGGAEPIVELRRPDGRLMMTVRQQVVTLHAFAPYVGWTEFSAHISAAMSAVDQVTKGTFDIEQLGVRYINRVQVPGHLSALSEYFRLSPLFFRKDEELMNFVSRSEYKLSEKPLRLLIGAFASGQSEHGREIVLDLDVIERGIDGLNTVADALDRIHELREVEREHFELAITDLARDELFGGFSVAD